MTAEVICRLAELPSASIRRSQRVPVCFLCKKEGQDLDDTKEYTVAVNNYLAGSDSYPQLAGAVETRRIFLL